MNLGSSTTCPTFLDGHAMPDYGVDMQEPATTLHLTAVVTPDDDWFMARCVEVPVVSQGPTIDEALANLTEALAQPGTAGNALQHLSACRPLRGRVSRPPLVGVPQAKDRLSGR